ncbi:MAG: hypothetical protein QM572_11955 [Nocardioides sp.]|uniref:hypothetical protein n=1 Tax=Nocardioides sp. TaxID=35761 RepID=UPI0039E38D1C
MLHALQAALGIERAVQDRRGDDVHDDDDVYDDVGDLFADFDPSDLPRPVNWNLLTADEAAIEWPALDEWIEWLRLSYGLPPAVVPPYWHRHDELVWELSALHTSWLTAYHPDGNPSGPLAWHRDFSDCRARLRDWVSTAGCRLDRDRPTRQATWPGEPIRSTGSEVEIHDRYADFQLFVAEDVAARRLIEQRVKQAVAPARDGRGDDDRNQGDDDDGAVVPG